MKYRVMGTIFEVSDCNCDYCPVDNDHEGDHILVDITVYANDRADAELKVVEMYMIEGNWDDYEWEDCIPTVTEVFVPS